MGAFQERITNTINGSITSIQAVYVPADDITDPAPATTFMHLDASTVLSRKLVELGIYPAIDPLNQIQKDYSQILLANDIMVLRATFKTFYNAIKSCKILLQFWVWKSFQKKINYWLIAQNVFKTFLTQPLFTAEFATGITRPLCTTRKSQLKILKKLLRGECDDLTGTSILHGWHFRRSKRKS